MVCRTSASLLMREPDVKQQTLVSYIGFLTEILLIRDSEPEVSFQGSNNIAVSGWGLLMRLKSQLELWEEAFSPVPTPPLAGLGSWFPIILNALVLVGARETIRMMIGGYGPKEFGILMYSRSINEDLSKSLLVTGLLLVERRQPWFDFLLSTRFLLVE